MGGERWPLRSTSGCEHLSLIVTTTLAQLGARSSRRFAAWAALAALMITAAGVTVTVVALLETSAYPADYRNGMLTTVSYAVPYAVTGSFLVARRPDLPFGWLLSFAAGLAALGSAAASVSYLEVSHGASERLAFVAFAVSGTAMLPTAVQGLVNVRFPSGRLSSRGGRVLEIALITGTGAR